MPFKDGFDLMILGVMVFFSALFGGLAALLSGWLVRTAEERRWGKVPGVMVAVWAIIALGLSSLLAGGLLLWERPPNWVAWIFALGVHLSLLMIHGSIVDRAFLRLVRGVTAWSWPSRWPYVVALVVLGLVGGAGVVCHRMREVAVEAAIAAAANDSDDDEQRDGEAPGEANANGH